ncbi:hypothetical protein Cgig2_003084 [Carnegiea gigantea]|uniref:Uncharacterized protein n=1 Tax=Carnegiea gigantea TaxID=171969 RepID=A0A9Q1KDX8_9CARY|nr:hypothetical protein Cgig2_003084 [Carnegiea gigantea]
MPSKTETKIQGYLRDTGYGGNGRPGPLFGSPCDSLTNFPGPIPIPYGPSKQKTGGVENTMSITSRLRHSNPVNCVGYPNLCNANNLITAICALVQLGQHINETKDPLTELGDCHQPKAIRGIDIKVMRQLNLAYLMKLDWRAVIETDSVWVQSLFHKYCKGKHELVALKPKQNASDA